MSTPDELMDAQRYRWLRNHALDESVRGPICLMADRDGNVIMRNGTRVELSGDALDKAIDGAMEDAKWP